ncbi:MAG: hypothetical protein ACR2RB_15580 [Gammaproteobacteria bacterium]
MYARIVFVFALFSGTADAATFYVRDGASGNGTDWSNAWGNMTAINWSIISRGDTIFVADGSYSGDSFDRANPGTTRIFIKKATASDHGPAAGWSSAFGDGVAIFSGQIEFKTGYWTFDGQVGTRTTGHGFVISMPNSNNAKGVRLTNSSNVTIAHTEIDGSAGSSRTGHDGFYSLGGADNLLLQHVYSHHQGRAPLLINSSDDVIVEHSVFQAPNANVTASGRQHSEIWSTSEGGGSNTPDDWTVRYNVFSDPVSTGGVMTSGLRWKVYGNIFTRSRAACGPTSCNNGILGGWSAQPGGRHQVYNNTFIDLTNQSGDIYPIAGGSGSIVRNNLFCGIGDYDNKAATKSHNAFGNSGDPGESEQQILFTSCEDIFVTYGAAAWQPLTDNFRLESATDPGQVLAAEFGTDPDGNIRGSDGTWDRGAFEFVEGASAIPKPPENLRIQ